MKRPLYRAGLILGAVSLASTGCHQASPREAVNSTKPDDPTAWSDKDLMKAGSESGASSSLPKSSRLQGTWSSEAQAVERSLGVGR